MSFLSRSANAGSRAASLMQARAFSSTPSARDLARVNLIGRLTRDAEVRKAKNDQDYVTYNVAVNQGYSAPDENGQRHPNPSNFYQIWAFREASIPGLSTLTKGTQVFVEADIAFKPQQLEDGTRGEPRPFFTHRSLHVISRPKPVEPAEES
ncbi:ssDNA-binding protein, mitochondrial [Naganishia albida]|nr:ssDNA-binding protein, mitochondrial [Naganishia albida]